MPRNISLGLLVLLLVFPAVASRTVLATEPVDPAEGLVGEGRAAHHPGVQPTEPDSKAFGRACLVMEDRSDLQSARRQPGVFDETASPQPGRHLVLHVDANVDVQVLVAVFNDGDRRLTQGWRPEHFKLEPWQEHRVPVAPTRWEWSQPTEAFEVDIVFLSKPDDGWEQARTLVEAMRNTQADPNLLALQARRLHDLFVRWTPANIQLAFRAGTTPSAWGGTLRGATFPWREHAKLVNLDSDGRGVLIFRYGG